MLPWVYLGQEEVERIVGKFQQRIKGVRLRDYRYGYNWWTEEAAMCLVKYTLASATPLLVKQVYAQGLKHLS